MSVCTQARTRSHTGAARTGVDNLTKSLAIKWVHDGMRVNAFAPVSARTTRKYNTCAILQSIIYSETAAANFIECYHGCVSGIRDRRTSICYS